MRILSSFNQQVIHKYKVTAKFDGRNECTKVNNRGGMSLRFSMLQQKEVIEAGNGRFIGFVIDAEVSKETGYVTAFLIAEPRKYLGFFKGEESVRKVYMKDVLVVGKDVILVKALS